MDIIAAILNFDYAVAFWMYHWGGTPPLDALTVLMSWVGTVRLVAVTFGIYFYFKKETRPITYVLFSAVLISMILVYFIKIAAHRPRPFVMLGINEADLLDKQSPYVSFPSGHTATAFATAAVLSYYFRKWAVPAFASAVCAGLARIYLLVHYPTDVIAGAAVGIFVPLSVIYIFSKIKKKQDERQNETEEDKENREKDKIDEKTMIRDGMIEEEMTIEEERKTETSF